MTFKDGATVLGTGTLNGTCIATYATAALTTGSHTITAVYGGNATYLSGPTGTVAQVVKQAATTTVIASSLNPSKAGDNVHGSGHLAGDWRSR